MNRLVTGTVLAALTLGMLGINPALAESPGAEGTPPAAEGQHAPEGEHSEVPDSADQGAADRSSTGTQTEPQPDAASQHAADDEVWFTEEIDAASAAALLESSEAEAPEESVRDRTAALDTAAALEALVAPESIDAAAPGERIVVPAESDIVLDLFASAPLDIEIYEVAVTLPLDGGQLPTVEVLGSGVADGEVTASASFVFVPDETGDYALAGGVQPAGETNEVVVQEIAEDVYRIDEVEVPQNLHEHGDAPSLVAPAEDIDLTAPPVAAAPSGTQSIDLLVGHASGTGTTAAMKTEMARRVAQTNDALARSQVRLRLVLLDTVAVNFTQTSDMNDDITNLQSGSGNLKPLVTRRDAVGADLVALIVPNQKEACGLAWTPDAAGSPSSAFSITAQSCLDNLTLSHELGHNLGGNHNPEVEPGPVSPYPYSYGKAVPGVARDIMAYACAPATPCPRMLQFSTPDVKFIGTSIASGDASKRNVAKSMNNMAVKIGNYRKHVIATDVPAGHKFYTEITWLVNRGITTGYADGTFRPGNPLIREAMAAFLYRYAGRPSFSPPSTSPFSDVPKSHQFYKEITWLKAKGITTGNANGTYGPGTSVSREAMAAFLYRYAGKPSFTPPATSPFSDVPRTHKFYREISWLKAKGITTGNANGTYGPGTAVTREAMAAFLYRYNSVIG